MKIEISSFLKQRKTEEWEVKSDVCVVYGIENDEKKRGLCEWKGWWRLKKMRVLMQSKRHMKKCKERGG